MKNIGYIPCAVQYILSDLFLYIGVCASKSPTLALPNPFPLPTNLFSISVKVWVLTHSLLGYNISLLSMCM